MNLKSVISRTLLYLVFLAVLSSNSICCLANDDLITISNAHYVFDSLPLNLEEITYSADKIFSGKCRKIEGKINLQSNLQTIKYTFKVIKNIKGLNGKKEYSFEQWKPITDQNDFKTREKYIVFLYPKSKIGLTSPVGITQGSFSVLKKSKGKKTVVINKLNNIGLSRNLRTQRKIVIKNNKELTEYIYNHSESGEPIGYKEFIEAVKYLLIQ